MGASELVSSLSGGLLALAVSRREKTEYGVKSFQKMRKSMNRSIFLAWMKHFNAFIGSVPE